MFPQILLYPYPYQRSTTAVDTKFEEGRLNGGHIAGHETFGAVVALPILPNARRGYYHSPKMLGWAGQLSAPFHFERPRDWGDSNLVSGRSGHAGGEFFGGV